MKDLEIQEKIEEIRVRCNFDFIKLALLQQTANYPELKSVYGSGNRSNRYLRIVLQTGKGLAGQVLKTGRPAFIVNVDEEINREDLHHYPIIIAEGLKSLGALPLYDDNRVIGVVLAGFRTSNKMTEELILNFQKEVSNEFGALFNSFQ